MGSEPITNIRGRTFVDLSSDKCIERFGHFIEIERSVHLESLGDKYVKLRVEEKEIGGKWAQTRKLLIDKVSDNFYIVYNNGTVDISSTPTVMINDDMFTLVYEYGGDTLVDIIRSEMEGDIND